jgi:hypothetical protein
MSRIEEQLNRHTDMLKRMRQQGTATSQPQIEAAHDATGPVICPKRIYFPKHFCYCFSSNLCVLNTTNTD